jgi:uncharacterized membrane protein
MTAMSLAAQPHGAIRSRRERLIQTLWFEALGIAIVSPLFAHFAGPSLGKSIIVLTALSVTMMCWSALYNTAFDLIEVRCTGRVASDRPHGLRVVHTIGNEATALIVTWPLMVALTPLAWLQALAADIGLTLAYALYGYLFHLGFDRLRPVRADAPMPTSTQSASEVRAPDEITRLYRVGSQARQAKIHATACADRPWDRRTSHRAAPCR